MPPKPAASSQTSFLMPTLGEQLDPRQPLKQLADTLPWSEFEQAFGRYYSAQGRPAKPVRLMVGLLLLKQMFNQGARRWWRRGCKIPTGNTSAG